MSPSGNSVGGLWHQALLLSKIVLLLVLFVSWTKIYNYISLISPDLSLNPLCDIWCMYVRSGNIYVSVVFWSVGHLGVTFLCSWLQRRRQWSTGSWISPSSSRLTCTEETWWPTTHMTRPAPVCKHIHTVSNTPCFPVLGVRFCKSCPGSSKECFHWFNDAQSLTCKQETFYPFSSECRNS